nr:hypothetical protein [Tanacetum cinerariifolium]
IKNRPLDQTGGPRDAEKERSLSQQALLQKLLPGALMEEPSHPEFDTGTEDQPFVQSSQHPKWCSQQQKPPSSDRDWNKTRINKAVQVALQLQSDKLREEAQKENDVFFKTIDENIQKIIKEHVKEQVKTSYAIAANLSEMELKKILIEKMEGNKSIQRSNEQRNLYKALVEAYESDKIILDTYGDAVSLKRHRDDDANRD